MNMREAFHIPEEDLIQYALGTLKDTQLSQFTAHISLCNDCRANLANFQVELAAFSTVLPQADPPSGARDRFLARLHSDSAPQSKLAKMRSNSPFFQALASFQQWISSPLPLQVAAAGMAVASLFLGYDDLSHIHQLRQMGPELARYQKQSAEFTALKEFLHGASAQQVSLRPGPVLQKTPEGHAIYAANGGRLLFTAANMPSPPAGKAYELWLLPAAGGAPIPAGVFKPDMAGNAAVVFPEIPTDVQAGGFGVTLESEAGSDKPTLPILLSGQ